MGSNNHKKAIDLLNRAATDGWQSITLPGVAGDIQILRIVVLWIHKSPQRLQEWDRREGVTHRIPYDVDIKWNYTIVMIRVALQHKVQLVVTIRENFELLHFKFDTSR